MFKKKPNIKPLAPLRSSDRRRTADQIIKDLDITIPQSEGDDEAAVAAARTTLRNALLPDNALSARFTTTQGPELRPVSGTVYVGNTGKGSEQHVLWIQHDGIYYPSVYTLWKNPGLVPLLHCGSNVISRLQDGADLMIPGLIYGPPFPTGAKKGSVVAVAGHDRPSVPFVVGRCVVDVAGLKETRGVKGVAVETFHWAGDEIWNWGGKGVEAPSEVEGWTRDLESRMKSLELEGGEDEDDDDDAEEDNGVALPQGSADDDTEPTEQVTEEPQADESPPPPPHDYTTPEIDTIFLNAFLYALNHYKSAYPTTKNFGLSFPLTQSFISSTMLQPFLPTFTQHDTQQLVIKKTSWKTVRKFIKYLDKQGVVKSKDRDGNESVVLDVDFEDRAVLSFIPYRLPRREATNGSSSSTAQGANEDGEGSDPSIGQKISINLFYKPPAKLSPLFTTSNDKEGPNPFYTSAEMKAVVASYIETENLISPTNKRLVNLDPFLANAVFDENSKGRDTKTTAIDKEALAKGVVARDVLAERVLSACAPFHTIVRNGNGNSADMKPKSGSPPKVTITLETRTGSKTVTKVSGLEPFFISPQLLAEELRKACAGSASVERLQGSSPKNPILEVMVQGPQERIVRGALGRRGVSERSVEVVDKVKKGKGR